MPSLYKLARKILPLSVQAKLGNRHKVKRRLLDPLFFRFTKHPNETRVFHETSQTPMARTLLEDNPHIPAPIATAYRKWYDHTQSQMVMRVEGEVWIEPKSGWPMGSSNQLYLSLNPAGITPYMATPGFGTIARKTPVVEFERIINLRDVNENGYSHFYSDIMAKLALISQQGISLSDYTLIIRKKVAETAYGKFLIAHAPLIQSAGGIFLQSNEFVRAKSGLFAHACVNPTHNFAMFQQVIEAAKAAHLVQGPVEDRKIFLTRAATRRRAIRNIAEIEHIAREFGFEVVDADTLTLPQQIELFTHCRHLIGIHGAGLVNMLYRYPHKLSVFELREPVRPRLGLNTQYHNTAMALRAEYGACLGEDTNTVNQSFYVSPAQFRTDYERFWQRVNR